MTTKLLTQTQAEAVYSAMRALNNVHGSNFHVVLLSHELRVLVDDFGGGVHIKQKTRRTTPAQTTREAHADHAAFAAAYGLN
jgi:hypothetical protein